MKITIAGTGYVGLSLATLLATEHKVTAYDIDKEKIEKINRRVSPIKDEYIEQYFNTQSLNLIATTSPTVAFADADYIIISTPTNYNDETNQFDTSSIETVLDQIQATNKTAAAIIIKSTVPVGYTKSIRKQYPGIDIIFSPEFLREGKALYDNLYPSRIIVGGDTESAHSFGELLKVCAKNNPPILYMEPTEAEAVKLFSNTYLALRIAYFNELDTYAEINGLSTKNIIDGVSLDPRIGNYYNNPSFGYGGYCLPKDTKQLLYNYGNIPQEIIKAIVSANNTRKKHIANIILKKLKPGDVIGVYRLTMKTSSDNFRSSAIQDIINDLKNHGHSIIIYEPTLHSESYGGCPVSQDFDAFIEKSNIILANRLDKRIKKAKYKVYSRDVFTRD